MKVLVAQLGSTLCEPMDCSLPGSSVHGILQAGILEWVTIPFSKGSSWPRDQTCASCSTRRFFTIWVTREAQTLGVTKSTANLVFLQNNLWRFLVYHCCCHHADLRECQAPFYALVQMWQYSTIPSNKTSPGRVLQISLSTTKAFRYSLGC